TRQEDYTPPGPHRRQVAVRHADSAGDARAEAVRLLAVNKVVALLAGPGSAATSAAGRAAGSEAAVLVAGDPTEPAREGVYALGVPAAERGRALARLAPSWRWRRALVVLDAREPVAVALASAFRAAWPTGTGYAVAERSREDAKDGAGMLAWK